MEKNSKNFDKNAKANKKVGRNLFFSTAILAFVLLMAIIGNLQVSNQDGVFGNGTYINGQSVSGYTVEKASQVVSNQMKEQIDGISIQIMYKDKIWKFNQDDFEVDGAVQQVVQNAYNTYHYGNLNSKAEKVSNSKILSSLTSSQNSVYNVSLKSTFKNFDEKIGEIVKEIETEPVNATVKFDPNSDNMFEVVEGKNGIKVDTEKLYQDLENQFLKTKDIKVYVNTSSVEPEINQSYFDNKLNLMSKFSTTLKGSQEGRRHNVDYALKKFNGKVIKADEKVSFNEVTGPQTLEGGYKTAIVILNGKFVDGVGGGICQASTTLYNALVLANLEIDEVHKHTLPVGYVELSLDAMVSEGYADMVFTNNSQDDIYIKTYTSEEEATVEIYGNSLPDGITVKRVAEFIGNIPHNGDKIQVDTAGEYTDKVLYKGEYYRVKYPREGYEAKAYKETFKDGKMISKEEIRHEKYQPIDGLIIEGAKEPPADYVIPKTDVEFIEPQQTESTSVETVVEKIQTDNPTRFNP